MKTSPISLRRNAARLFQAAAFLSVGMGSALAATPIGFVDRGSGADLAPTGKGWGEQRGQGKELATFPGNNAARPGGAGGSNNGISYRGGPVMTSDVTVYYIWYGNWTGNSAKTILTDFANTIGGSPYFNINTTYYAGDVNKTKVRNTATSPRLYGVQAAVETGYKTALSDLDIQNVVASHINDNLLPKDPNGVYFVLTSADVTATSGFCTKYCGWHTHATIGGTDIKYSFVGNPDRCPSACAAQTSSPNDNPGADGMASIVAHELEEAVTDPDLNAWYDNRGYENADKCAWTFGTTYPAPNGNGSKANMKIGTRDYLIQRNWVNASGGYCSLSY